MDHGNSEDLTPSQELLLELLHTQVCRNDESKASPCFLTFCIERKKLYKHVANCFNGLECREHLCVISRGLLKHYCDCTEDDCELCGPVRAQHELNLSSTYTLTEFLFPSSLPSDPNPFQWKWPLDELNSPISISKNKKSHQPRLVSDLSIVPFVCDNAKSLELSSQRRTEMIHSIIDFTLPNSSPEIYNDPMISDVIDYASRLEYIAFTGANSIESYNTTALKLAASAKSELEKENWIQKYDETSEKSISVRENRPIDKTKWKRWFKLEIYDVFAPLTKNLMTSNEGCYFRDLTHLRPSRRFNSRRVPLPEMDLNTIMSKLENGSYSDPWDVVKDFHQIYKYVSQNFEECEPIHRAATEFLKSFCSSADPLMQKLGYCCGTYYYKAITFTCDSGNNCQIRTGHEYLEYLNSDKKMLSKNLYRICYQCFEKLEYKGIFTDDSNKSAVLIQRDQLSDILVNKAQADEYLIWCRECGRRFHALCVLYKEYMWPNGYICANCVRSSNKLPTQNLLTAKNLPRNKLSDFMEEKVGIFLKKKNIITNEVRIRVLSSVDMFMQVKPLMRAYLRAKQMPIEPFPYRQKVIFAFQEVDGKEVCIFGFYSHEHGLNSLPPNRGRVFIECVDCLRYFQPESECSVLYQTIMAAYLEYIRNLGFWCAHLCSGTKEDDEVVGIFYGHSPSVLMRNRASRRVLYNGIFQILMNEFIAEGVEDIYDEALRSNTRYITDIPYFQGDLWPDVIEFCIKHAFDKVRQIAKTPISLVDITKNPSILFTFDEASKNLLYDTLKDYRKDFHVVRLSSPFNPSLIADPDEPIWGHCLQNRENFVREVDRNKLDFTILREAKFLTTSMLFELHKENNGMKLYFCRNCQSIISKRWKCNICQDFYLCPDCHQMGKHPHFMLECQLKSAPPTYAVPTFLADLSHVSQCHRSCCRYENCGLTKMLYNHFITCPQRSSVLCSSCYQIIRYIASHSTQCDRANCPVPFCKDPRVRSNLPPPVLPHGGSVGSSHSIQSQNQFSRTTTSITGPHPIYGIQQQQQIMTGWNNPQRIN